MSTWSVETFMGSQGGWTGYPVACSAKLNTLHLIALCFSTAQRSMLMYNSIKGLKSIYMLFFSGFKKEPCYARIGDMRDKH